MKWKIIFCALALSLISCKDEITIVRISFSGFERTVDESNGDLDSFHPELLPSAIGVDYTVVIQLNGKLESDVVLIYSVTGTAKGNNPSGEGVNDFTIKSGVNTFVGSNQIVIKKGATSASIIVTVYEDLEFETDEDNNSLEYLQINFLSVASGPGTIGGGGTYRINIEEDDFLIWLKWFVDDGDTHGDVDMDLFVWFEGEILTYSAWSNNDPQAPNPPWETVHIPAGFPDGTYGISYNYFSGTSDHLFVSPRLYGRLVGNRYPYFSSEYLSYGSVYGLHNINNYTETGVNPAVVQQMVKKGLHMTSVSPLQRPISGSRQTFGNFNVERSRHSGFIFQ